MFQLAMIRRFECITALVFLILRLSISQNDTTESPEDDIPQFWNDKIISIMIGCGLGGGTICLLLLLHCVYHFGHDKVKIEGLTRWANVITFATSTLACLSYAFIKVDVFTPIGTVISCSIGYSVSTSLIALAKVCTFFLFTLRIHITFSGSTFAYQKKTLLAFLASYSLFATLFLTVALYAANVGLIDYRITEGGIGVCSTFKVDGDLMFIGALAGAGLGDIIHSGVLVYLFVSKLRQLVKMTSGGPPPQDRSRVKSVDNTHSGSSGVGNHDTRTIPKRYESEDETDHSRTAELKPKPTLKTRMSSRFRKRGESKSKSSNSHDHNQKLKRVMVKQTLLFLISVLSSVFFWVFGALFSSVSLFIPVDTTINAICIWFMFRFADDLWNQIVHCCDCCGCCGGFKEDLMYRMNTISRLTRTMSLRTELKGQSTDDGHDSRQGSHDHMHDDKNTKTALSPTLKSVSENGDHDHDTNEGQAINMDRLHSGHDPIMPTQITDRGGKDDHDHLDVRTPESARDMTPDISYGSKLNESTNNQNAKPVVVLSDTDAYHQ